MCFYVILPSMFTDPFAKKMVGCYYVLLLTLIACVAGNLVLQLIFYEELEFTEAEYNEDFFVKVADEWRAAPIVDITVSNADCVFP